MVGLQHIVITTQPPKKYRKKTHIDTQQNNKNPAISKLCRHLFFGHIVSSSRLASPGSHGHPGRQFDETLPQGGGIVVEKRIGGIVVETWRETMGNVQQLWGNKVKRLVDSLVMSRFHMLEFFI